MSCKTKMCPVVFLRCSWVTVRLGRRFVRCPCVYLDASRAGGLIIGLPSRSLHAGGAGRRSLQKRDGWRTCRGFRFAARTLSLSLDHTGGFPYGAGPLRGDLMPFLSAGDLMLHTRTTAPACAACNPEGGVGLCPDCRAPPDRVLFVCANCLHRDSGPLSAVPEGVHASVGDTIRTNVCARCSELSVENHGHRRVPSEEAS